MMLKQHRKATLELRGNYEGGGRRSLRLIGNLNVSLQNAGDRKTLLEFIRELRKQWHLAVSEAAAVAEGIEE